VASGPFVVRRAFFVAAAIVFTAHVVGLITAYAQNVPDSAAGGPAQDTWLTAGTAYSGPMPFIVIACLALYFSRRAGWTGVVPTALVMLVCTMSEASAPGDWLGTQAAFNHHFAITGFVAVWTLLILNPVAVLLGATDLVNRFRGRVS
jgi:hypothetical protein